MVVLMDDAASARLPLNGEIKMRVLSVLVMTAATPGPAQTPTITGVIGESGSKSVSPGGIAFVQGTNLGTTSTQVTVGAKQAYVFNGGGTGLQIEIPVDAPLGATTLTAGTSAPFSITLVQYSPGLSINNGLVQAYHYLSQQPVTTAFPASPNEQIAVEATGLGPTNPVFPTGTSANDTSRRSPSRCPPSASKAKRQPSAARFWSPAAPAFTWWSSMCRRVSPPAAKELIVSIGGLSSETGAIPIATGPVIGSVTNAASYIDPKLPNGGIAQGAIAVIKGANLGPTTLSVASNAFQNTTLSGTSVRYHGRREPR